MRWRGPSEVLVLLDDRAPPGTVVGRSDHRVLTGDRADRHQYAVDAACSQLRQIAGIGRHAGRDLDGFGITTVFLGGAPGQFDQLGGCAPRWEVAVAEPSRPAGGGFGVTTDDDRHRRLCGSGTAVDVLEVDELALKGRTVLGPQGPHGRHVLVGAFPPGRERDTERLELLTEPSHADAEHHPSAGEPVEARDLLGRDHRVVLGNDEDAGCEPQRGGDAGHERHPDQRVGTRHVVHASGHASTVVIWVGRRVAGWHDRVLDGPRGLEPGGLGRLDQLGADRTVDVGAGVAVANPELHAPILPIVDAAGEIRNMPELGPPERSCLARGLVEAASRDEPGGSVTPLA